MRTFCIFNHKGGVGKTTTAINLAAGLSRLDKKVLLVDLDPQGNIDLSLKIGAQCSIQDVLEGHVDLQSCIKNAATNFDVISSSESLTKVEYYLAKESEYAQKFREALLGISGYDYLIVDCPPSLGVLNQLVLSSCDEVIVPVSMDYLGYDALKKMPKVIEAINKHYGRNTKIAKIVPTLFDSRNKICRETLAAVQNEFASLVAEPIHTNSKIKEAPKYGKSIFSYAKSSPGAKDYQKLVEAVIALG